MKTIKDTRTLAVISESASHIAFVNGNTYKREEVVRAVNSFEELLTVLKVTLKLARDGYSPDKDLLAKAISRAESPR